MGVGFALEGDGAVGMVGVAVLDEAEEPFEDVEDVEGDVEELSHLGRVDALVVYGDGMAGAFGEEKAEEVYGVEFLSDGDDFIDDYFHGGGASQRLLHLNKRGVEYFSSGGREFFFLEEDKIREGNKKVAD